MGCGSGMDSLVAARMVGPKGRVIGVDMTPAMLAKAKDGASAAVAAAGFIGFVITSRGDVYAGAPQESSAAEFGTLGIDFHARKHRTEVE